MTDKRPRIPALAILVPSVLAGALMVFGALQLRPDRGPQRVDARRLAALFVAPAGYSRVTDEQSGAGPVPIEAAGRKMGFASPLNSGDLESAGFVAAYDRAWGRPDDQPARAVLTFISAYDDADGAATVAALLRTRHASASFRIDGPPDAFGFADSPDESGRHYQRIVFAKDDLVVVVSIITPAADRDTAEIARLAQAQYDALP